MRARKHLECEPRSALDALGNGRFLLCAGFIHLQSPDAFLPMMLLGARAPEGYSDHRRVRNCRRTWTGARSFRWWAAVMLALYAVCVFPANIKHAFENVQLPQLPSSWWYHGPRLALQPVICGGRSIAGTISWPFGRGRGISGRDIQ